MPRVESSFGRIKMEMLRDNQKKYASIIALGAEIRSNFRLFYAWLPVLPQAFCISLFQKNGATKKNQIYSKETCSCNLIFCSD